MSVTFRIFKENSLNRDTRTASTLGQAMAIYRQYFAEGYAVRVVEIETGAEYAMCDEKLVPVPYSQAMHRHRTFKADDA
jgi:hypothetical protein